VTKAAGLAIEVYGMGCAIADYNNDGFQDLYLTSIGPNHLFRNNGNGTFTDVTAKAKVQGVPVESGGIQWKWSTSAAWLQRADALLAALPRRRGQTIAWREGSGGWLRAKFVGVRCQRVDGDGTRHMGWLIGQRPTQGEGEWKYFWSNFPPPTRLEVMVEYAHRRWWVEQYHEEAKGLLGWGDYQGRLWPGFHRPAVLVMLSYSFLVWLEWRQRGRQVLRGRPRGRFSPPVGSAAVVAASHPSPGGGLVTGASDTRVSGAESH
jgi:hypothetical protein